MAEVNSLVLVRPEANPEIMAFYDEAIKLKEYAELRVIVTNDDLKPATDDLSIIAKVKKGMEEQRKEYLKPFQDHVKGTNDAFKSLMEPVDQADKITREKILAFRSEQERKRKEAETIEAEKLELAKREAELKGGEITVDLSPVDKPDAVPDRVRTDMGTTGSRDNWKWEVIDFAQVPDEYKMVNAGMLTPVVKASKGKINIPGIRIFNAPIIAVNTK